RPSVADVEEIPRHSRSVPMADGSLRAAMCRPCGFERFTSAGKTLRRPRPVVDVEALPAGWEDVQHSAPIPEAAGSPVPRIFQHAHSGGEIVGLAARAETLVTQLYCTLRTAPPTKHVTNVLVLKWRP